MRAIVKRFAPRAIVSAVLLSLVVSALPNVAAARDADFFGAATDDNGNLIGRAAARAALPDIFGPGSVLTVGNIQMKVTNAGVLGNPFQNTSSDPSGQWPGASGIEYLFFIGFAAGAVNPTATDPTAIRRVSYATEWRPPTLDSEDKIYRAYDGIVNGARYANDDGDRDPFTDEPLVDEDFLDGRDNDGDGLIDEDHAALGQQLYSCVIRDDTEQAINTTFNEKHVPLGLECQQKAWAYSILGFQDFIAAEFKVINISGHRLDSLVLGWRVDMDSGPVDQSSYWSDDYDVPTFPSGEFTLVVGSNPGQLVDPVRRQFPHSDLLNGTVPPESALCPRVTIRTNGFSVVDDNGDDGRTPGVASFLLFDHTVDPTGQMGPARVGFKSFRSHTGGTPYTSGGNPTIDQQRFEFMISGEHVDPETGQINAHPGDTRGDYQAWCSIGPWRNIPNGGSVTATVGFAVAPGKFQDLQGYPLAYQRFKGGSMTAAELLQAYPGLANALTAQIAFEGINEINDLYPQTTFHGRETPLRAAPGAPAFLAADCRDIEKGTQRVVNDLQYTWFDFDCNYCTGVYNASNQRGYFHKTWNAAAPPPAPNVNTALDYNFTDNPYRKVTPGGDDAVRLAWDNLSEVTPDPKSKWFDFRGYRIWKVADWKRPVGSPGPAESDWKLLGEFRKFEYRNNTGSYMANNLKVNAQGDTVCPKVFIPNYRNPDTGVIGPDSVEICLTRGDLWNRQSGEVIHPDTTLRCAGDFVDPPDSCQVFEGCILHAPNCGLPQNLEDRTLYPIGRYTLVDREVKNGFLYFYSITAFDSTYELGVKNELGGRRSAVEAEGVEPQVSTGTGKGVWVVPNPYRGFARLNERPSAWDLTPSASDPTGTHIDFMGLPAGQWTIKIFTVSGDLVAELHSTDPINESIRQPVKDPYNNAVQYSGVTRQQDNPNDGQARWNLISRNGQDIVSGIYIFTVESDEGTQRGKFVVVR